MSSYQHETASCFLCTSKFTQKSFEINFGAEVCSTFVKFVAQYLEAQIDYEKPIADIKNRNTLNDESKASESDTDNKTPTTSDNETRHACPRCLYRVQLFCQNYRSWTNLGKLLDSTLDEIEQIHITAHVTTHSEGQLDPDTECTIIEEFLTKACEERRQVSGRNWQGQDDSMKVKFEESHNQSYESEEAFVTTPDKNAQEGQIENKFNKSSENEPGYHSTMDSDGYALREKNILDMKMNSKMDSKSGDGDKPHAEANTSLRPNILPTESEEEKLSMETQSHQEAQVFDPVPDQRQDESKNKTEKRRYYLRSQSRSQSPSLMTNLPIAVIAMDQPEDFQCPKESDKDEGKQTENATADCQVIRPRPPLKMVVNLKHLKHQEQMRKPFRCRFCPKRFKTKIRLRQHFHRRHYLKQRILQLKQQMGRKIIKFYTKYNSQKVN